jgi:lactobin A/cerein 7B family class IIb bacteriocin
MGNKFGLTDLSDHELKEVNGGTIWQALVIAAIVAVITDWDNFKAGLSGKPELAKK